MLCMSRFEHETERGHSVLSRYGNSYLLNTECPSEAQCLRTLQTSNGQETSSSKCQALAGIMHNSTKMCTGTERCGYGLVTSEWGPCSVLCGSGVEERLAECLRSDGIVIDRSNPALCVCVCLRACVSVGVGV